MALNFYPHSEDARKGPLEVRIETLLEAAHKYKAVVLDAASKPVEVPSGINNQKRMVPRDQVLAAYNWEEIAIVLREVRDLSEVNKPMKLKKGDLLFKLAEVYEVLRAAKMSKLEAVRLALINEATQLRASGSQVA
jgi:hypothetical protein